MSYILYDLGYVIYACFLSVSEYFLSTFHFPKTIFINDSLESQHQRTVSLDFYLYTGNYLSLIFLFCFIYIMMHSERVLSYHIRKMSHGWGSYRKEYIYILFLLKYFSSIPIYPPKSFVSSLELFLQCWLSECLWKYTIKFCHFFLFL